MSYFRLALLSLRPCGALWQTSTRFSSTARPMYYEAVSKYSNNIALTDHHASYTYGQLYSLSSQLSRRLLPLARAQKSESQSSAGSNNSVQIGVLCPNNASFVIAMWASWMVGATVVPLSSLHPPASISYFLDDAHCCGVIVGDERSHDLITTTLTDHSRKPLPIIQIDKKFLTTETINSDVRDDLVLSTTAIDRTRRSNALIIYTSGTSGRPKGCVLTFDNVQAHIDSMVKAWGWTKDDVMLHVLPLHHVHGLLNALVTPLFVGASVIMLPSFDASKTWEHLVQPGFERHVTVFTAVPTIYSKLIQNYEVKLATRPQANEFVKTQCSQMIRLMMCGSAALPDTIHRRWYEVTGHQLLERYGMTECGMALSNPLVGERIAGTVGRPMPNVTVRIVRENANSPLGYDTLVEADTENTKIEVENKSEPIEGELYIQGPTIFKEYWRKRTETRATFTADGTFFKTGDVCQYDPQRNTFSIRGRQSMDIIKRAGYKISALDVERVLLEHDEILECSVVGIEDNTLGQKIVAVIVPKFSNRINNLTIESLREYGKKSLPHYSLPDSIRILEQIPRNAMGKVNKKELAGLIV